MNAKEIIKRCPKHGELSKEECFIIVEKRWGNKPKEYYSCKACKKESSDKYRYSALFLENKNNRALSQSKTHQKYREIILSKKRKYNMENKEKIKLQNFKRRQNNLERARNRERDIQKKWRDELDNNYIKSLIYRTMDLTALEIPLELIEVKRFQIKLKRLIKEKLGK